MKFMLGAQYQSLFEMVDNVLRNVYRWRDKSKIIFEFE